jgi:hypothetical protein
LFSNGIYSFLLFPCSISDTFLFYINCPQNKPKNCPLFTNVLYLLSHLFLVLSFFSVLPIIINTSVASRAHFYAAPAPSKNFDAAPAPTLPFGRPTFLKARKLTLGFGLFYLCFSMIAIVANMI